MFLRLDTINFTDVSAYFFDFCDSFPLPTVDAVTLVQPCYHTILVRDPLVGVDTHGKTRGCYLFTRFAGLLRASCHSPTGKAEEPCPWDYNDSEIDYRPVGRLLTLFIKSCQEKNSQPWTSRSSCFDDGVFRGREQPVFCGCIPVVCAQVPGEILMNQFFLRFSESSGKGFVQKASLPSGGKGKSISLGTLRLCGETIFLPHAELQAKRKGLVVRTSVRRECG